jgi:hypothetical protein
MSRSLPVRLLAIGAAAAGLVLVSPLRANAAVEITSFSLTPSTTRAGAHPDLRVSASLTGSGAGVRDFVVHLPNGVLGAPAAVVLCNEGSLRRDRCSRRSKIGSITVDAEVSGVKVIGRGEIFMMGPTAAVPARLGIGVRVGQNRVVIVVPASVREAGNFGIDAALRNLPAQLAGLDVRLNRVDVVVKGRVGGSPFTYNPTSCAAAVAVLDVVLTDGSAASSSSTFTPTGCGGLPFAPRLNMSLGARGETEEDSHPPVRIGLSQARGAAAFRSAQIVLPDSLFPDSAAPAVGNLCEPEQIARRACPNVSRLGSGSVKTPLLRQPLSASFHLSRPPEGAVAGVVVVIRAKGLSLALPGAITFKGDTRVITTLDQLPDVPVRRFNQRLIGGRDGAMQATRDLCSGSAGQIEGHFTAHSGREVSVRSKARVRGC